MSVLISRISASESIDASISSNDLSVTVTPSVPNHFDGWAYSLDGNLYHTIVGSTAQNLTYSSYGSKTLFLRGINVISDEEILDNEAISKTFLLEVSDTSGGSSETSTAIDFSSNGSWEQIGADIDGEASGDESGSSISLNSDGTVVAIGAPGNGSDSGHVRVYENSSGLGTGSWTQLGDDIDGEANSDCSGYSVSLSSDGTIVAIGATKNDGNGADSGHVRVYEYSSGSWTQLGDDIDGEAAGDYSGYSVSLSSNGTIVAIGATKNDGNGADSGHVRVYQYSSGSWIQLGDDIDGEAAADGIGNLTYGMSVSLSSDGTIVAIGATGNDDNGDRSGHVRVYEYSSGSWTQLGSDIDGEAQYDWSGGAVSLSSDGTIVAIGAVGNDGHLTHPNAFGHVRVYEYDSGAADWTQLGDDIDGEASGDGSGRSVSLSSDGTIVAIGAKYNSDNGYAAGHVRVYKYDSGSWTQIDEDIDGERYSDYSGSSISLSSNGGTLAIGAPGNPGGSNTGHVRVYKFEVPTVFTSPWTLLGDDISGSNNDNVGRAVSLSSDGTIVAVAGTDKLGIYEYSSGSWTQLGSNLPSPLINGTGVYSFGNDYVSLSSDGTIVALGYTQTYRSQYEPGYVRVFEYSSGSWTQLGDDIEGEANGDRNGYSVSLSSDGTVVAMSSMTNDDGGTSAGSVRIFQYSSGSWTQLGSDIDGSYDSEFSGHSLSLSSDGTIVAIGSPSDYADSSNDHGRTRIYEYSSGSWTQLGDDIDGAGHRDMAGHSVSLSSDGTIVAIGAPQVTLSSSTHSTVNPRTGYVRVYQYSSGSWTQLGDDIRGDQENGRTGFSVALSSNGETLAITAPFEDSSDGRVSVFEYSSGSWTEVGYQQMQDAEDNGAIITQGTIRMTGGEESTGFGYSVAISSDGTIVAGGSKDHNFGAGHARIFEKS